MAGEWPRLPAYEAEADAASVAPEGWGVAQIETLYEQLPIGRRYEQKMSEPVGTVPVIDQSSDGVIGWHNDEPGVVASADRPVVTFANHTCEMRFMRRSFSVIQNVFPLVGRKGLCDTRFLYYGTKGRVHLEEYKGHYPDFRRKWISLPPLSEQRAIAQILGALDDKIELNRWMNETLEAIARVLFKSWFVDFEPVRAKADGRDPGLPKHIADLFPDSFEDSELGEIPAGWQVLTVEDIAEINAWILSRSDPLPVIDYIEISEVMRGEISTIVRYARGEEPSRARRRLRHGDTVLSTVRPDRGAHFLCLHPSESLIASTGFAVLSPRAGDWAYLHAAITHREVGEELGRLADGGAYPAVRPEAVGKLSLVVPRSPDLRVKFHEIVGPLFERADKNRMESRTLAGLRDTLLPKLISGELRVPDAERIIGRQSA